MEMELESEQRHDAPGGYGEMSEASYSPFKLESYRLVQMKEQFGDLLQIVDYGNAAQRDLVIRTADKLYSETYGVLIRDDVKPADLIRIEGLISDMREVQNKIGTLTSGMPLYNIPAGFADYLKTLTTQFQERAYRFLRQMSQALTDRNLGIKMKEKEWQIDRLKNIFGAKNTFENKFGIPISIEMELFCRLCVQRVNNEYDNLFIVEADTGRGKTNFAWAAASTIAQMMGLTFSVQDNFIFNESRGYVDKLLRTAPHGVSLVFDEIGNQANSKTHWDLEQVTLMNDWRLIRFVGMTIFGCWTSKDELDKQLRTRVNGIITIEERGVAHYRTYNRNRYSAKKEYIPYEIKNKVAYTSKEADALIEEHDAFNHLDIPFYKIPDDLWAPYIIEKGLARTMKRAGAKWLGERTVTAAEQYSLFLAQIPADCSKITPAMLVLYSNKQGYSLSWKALLKKVSTDIGIKMGALFQSNNNILDEWDGYIAVDDLLRGYIERIKARIKGGDEA